MNYAQDDLTRIAGQLRHEMKTADDGLLESAMSALGEELIRERKRYEARLESELAKLRIEFLQQQLDEARGVKRPLKIVPADKGTMIG